MVIKTPMKKFFSKISKASLIGLTLYAVPLVARADWWDDLSSVAEFVASPQKILFYILTAIVYVVGYLGGLLLTLFAALTDFALDINTKILPDTIGTITRGFETTLSIANLFFVVALIIIAFATILQIENFSMRRLLGKLILAAVLINFSLLIVGLFLDMSHVLTNFFLSGGNVEQVNGVYSLGGSIANSVNPAGFLVEPSLSQISGEFSQSITVLISAIFMTIFTWILAITMGGIAVMFVVRYVALTFLIILMPLAWVSPLIPVKYFSDIGPKWWDNFLQQVFFLPIVAFFLIIATQSASGLTSAINSISSGFTNYESSLSASGLQPSLLQAFLQLFVLIGLLIGGMKAAVSTGGVAGKIGNTFAEKAKKASLGLGRKTLQKTGIESGARNAAGQLAPSIARIPLMQGLANKLAGVADPEKAIQSRTKADYEHLMKTEAGQKALAAKGPDRFDQEDQVAFLKAFAKEGALDELAVKKRDGSLNRDATMRKIEPLVEAMKKSNPGVPPAKIKELQALAATFPKLAAQITGQSARQALNGADVKNLSDETITENIELFSQRQLSTIAKESDSKELLVNNALAAQLKNVEGGKLKAGGDQSIVSQLERINTQLKTATDTEKSPSVEQDKKDAAGKEVQSLLRQRADIVEKIDVEKISVEERSIVNNMRQIAYAVGSATAQAKKPKGSKEEKENNDRFEKPTSPEAQAAADKLFENIT